MNALISAITVRPQGRVPATGSASGRNFILRRFIGLDKSKKTQRSGTSVQPWSNPIRRSNTPHNPGNTWCRTTIHFHFPPLNPLNHWTFYEHSRWKGFDDALIRLLESPHPISVKVVPYTGYCTDGNQGGLTHKEVTSLLEGSLYLIDIEIKLNGDPTWFDKPPPRFI